MTRIRLRSVRFAALAALTAQPRGLATLILACSVAGCTFDVTPRAAPDERSAGAAWRPDTSTRDGGSSEQQMRAASAVGRADAQSSTADMTSDGGMRPRDPDAGRSAVDAGQTKQEPARRDAGRGVENAAGSASPMETPGALDASAPGQLRPDTSRCMPGIYEGNFEGPVTFAVGSINRVTGTMSAEAVLDPSGSFLSLRAGTITGMDSLGVRMSATWTGNVSCATSQLEDGRLEAGAWDNGSTFTGTLEGTYTPSPHAMSGKWQVESVEIPFAGGNGDWRMTLRGSSAP